MGADKLAENIPNAPKFICPNCLTKPKRLGFRWKKSSLDVRSPWATLYRQSDIAKFLLDIRVLYSIFGRPGGAILKAIDVIKKRQIYRGWPSDLNPPSTILMAYQDWTFFCSKRPPPPEHVFSLWYPKGKKNPLGDQRKKLPLVPQRKENFLFFGVGPLKKVFSYIPPGLFGRFESNSQCKFWNWENAADTTDWRFL